jgi:hypothetical protein
MLYLQVYYTSLCVPSGVKKYISTPNSLQYVQPGHLWYKSVFGIHPCLRTLGDDVTFK